MKGIADTGFLVAFANANDKHHKWAAQLATGVTEPLLTCEAVIAETAFHLESAAVALAMVNEGLVALAFDCRENLVQLARLADRFADQKPDLADLCLVRMSELFPKHSVITIDRTDFQHRLGAGRCNSVYGAAAARGLAVCIERSARGAVEIAVACHDETRAGASYLALD